MESVLDNSTFFKPVNQTLPGNENSEMSPSRWLLCMIIKGLTSAVGTFGNVTVVYLVWRDRKLRGREALFIVNLALADLYVTLVANPVSILGKLKGQEFFLSIPMTCQIIACLCTISCVTSQLTISILGVHRYICLRYHKLYRRISTKRNCAFTVVGIYSVGIVMVSLNAVGIGDHTFDIKSLECIWDRLATYYYTVFLSVGLMFIPSVAVGLLYLRIYLLVRHFDRRMEVHVKLNGDRYPAVRHATSVKTLFIIYAVFTVCWIPHGVLIVLDYDDRYSQVVHVYLSTFAHMHPSLTWIVYYFTSKQFAQAYKQLFTNIFNCRKKEKVKSDYYM